jgi:RimJ/RimL family protein N-acetyltransferase
MTSGSFESLVTDTFKALKAGDGEQGGLDLDLPGWRLRPVTASCQESETLSRFTRWRAENIEGFTEHFTPTDERTASWLAKGVLERSDRMLFEIVSAEGSSVGHVGLSSFDFERSTCELDNIVRGERSAPKGLMSQACQRLIDWTSSTLRPRAIELRVLHDNIRALALYHRLGFQPVELIPLHESRGEATICWEPAQAEESVDRFFLRMRLSRIATIDD